MVLFLLCGLARGQDIDWSACTKVTAPMEAAVKKFNAGRTDGLSIWLTCQRGQSVAEVKSNKPVRHVPLTKVEAATLNELCAESDKAYKAQTAYEDSLILRHGIHKPEIGDPCYRFIGFVLDDDFITDEQNPMMPFMCHLPQDGR